MRCSWPSKRRPADAGGAAGGRRGGRRGGRQLGGCWAAGVDRQTELLSWCAGRRSCRRSTVSGSGWLEGASSSLRRCLLAAADTLLCAAFAAVWPVDPDLIICGKLPGIAIARVGPRHDGQCVGYACDSFVNPAVLARICDECNYGSFEGRCVITGEPGVADAYYCKECVKLEKDRDGCPKIINLGSARTVRQSLPHLWRSKQLVPVRSLNAVLFCVRRICSMNAKSTVSRSVKRNPSCVYCLLAQAL